jgi:glycosyltransferase involved in cell wall biosynthesis
MRILNVRANMHPVRGGGSAERALLMSRILARQPGVEVAHLSLDLGPREEWARELEGVEVTTLPCINARFQVPAPSSRRIGELVRAADVVHMTGHWSLLNAAVYRHARKLGVPHVVCPAGALPIFGRSKRLKRLYNRMIGTELVRTAARHIAITKDEIPQLIAHGATCDSVRVIANGVFPEQYGYRNDDGFRRRFELGDAPFILFLGRLNRIKGPDLLVEAFATIKDRFPDHLLVLAGADEGLLAHLRGLTAKHGLGDRVRFIGHITGPTKSAAYHAAELLTIPSRQEAMSMVVIEGGAAGTPVVATNRCGLSDLEEIGAGIIAAPNVDDIAKGIADALADPARRRSMAQVLHAHTLENFSSEVISAQLLEMFRGVVEESTGGDHAESFRS